MKRGLILTSLAAVAVVYGAIGFLGVPYAIKHIAPQKVHDATEGGIFSVESVSFNPFTFHLSLKKMAFKTPKEGDLLSIEQFRINLNPLSYLWQRGWVIDNILIYGPKALIHRDAQGEFNFKWLTELSKSEEPEKPSEPLKLLIKNFTLKEGGVAYRDESEGREYALDAGPIGFSLQNIDLRDLSASKGALRLYATINEGGFVDVKGKIDALSPLVIGGHIAFDSGKLYTPWRYFKDKFPIEVADGKAAFGFDYRINGDDINATELSNLTFDVNKLRIIPKGEQRNLLSMGGLHLRGGKVLPMRRFFSAESLRISGVDVAATRSKEGVIDWVHYLGEIQKAFPSDANETEEVKVPWSVALNRFDLEGVGVTWNDNAPLEPYLLRLENLAMHTSSLSSDEKHPLNLSLATDSLSLNRQTDGAAIAGFTGLVIGGIMVDRADQTARVAAVQLNKPFIALKRLKNGKLDVERYVYRSKVKSESSAQTPWSYMVDSAVLSEGVIRFIDEVPSQKVALDVEQLNLNVGNFSSDPKVANRITVSATINQKSTLRAQADLVRDTLRSNGHFELKGVNVATFDPYLQPSTYASIHRGNLSLEGDYKYGSGKANVTGKVALNDWVIDDARDETVLTGWQSIGVTPFVYAYPDNRLKINQLAVDGFYVNTLIDEKKVLNFSTLSKKSPSEGNVSRSEGNGFGIDIVKLLIRDSSATFGDLSLPLPFKTYIHDLEGSVLGISTTKDVTTFVKLRGGVDKYGLAKIDGQLNTKAPKQFTDLTLAFENLELKQYTPYSLQFLGYHIADGRLFLHLGYKIDGGKLKGDNKVVIKKIELGAEKEGGSPWPMRLVVALLEDSDGIIDLDLPVQGDVNHPDFKYGKVVWQVIGNLLTKAVTSPFRLLSAMMGIESDTLSSIDFEGGSATLLPPQIEKLDQITAILQKRPKLALSVYGSWDTLIDGDALKGEKLVQAAREREKKLKIDSPQAITLELLEEMAEEALEKKELKSLRTKLAEEHKEESAYVRYYSAELIERLKVRQSITQEELATLAQKRADQIRHYLIKTPGFEKRIFIQKNEEAKKGNAGEIPLRLEVVVP